MTFVAALTVAAALTTSCSTEQFPESNNAKTTSEVKTYTLSIPAFKAYADANALTRQITEDNTTGALTTKWLTTEKVYAYINDTGDPIELTPSNLTNNDQKATLTGNITKSGGFKDGSVQGETADKITLYYLKPKTAYDNYNGQIGTLANIAANFDFMKAEVTVTAVIPNGGDDNILATSAATFVRQQAITKFTVKKKGDNSNFDITPVTMNDGTTTLTVTPSPAAHEIWVALPGRASTDAAASKSYKFETTSESKVYGATKSVDLVNNRYYTATLTLGRDIEKVSVTGLPAADTGSTQPYTGLAVNVTEVKNNENETMTPTTDYTVTYYKNDGTTDDPSWTEVSDPDEVKTAGEYKAVITGAGEYEGTYETTFSITKTPAADVNAAIAAGTIADGTQINQGTNTAIVPTTVLGLTGAQIVADTNADTHITIGTLTPAGSWAEINANGELVTTGGGIVEVTIGIAATDDHEAGSVTKTLYVKQSGIGGEVPNPDTPSTGGF